MLKKSANISGKKFKKCLYCGPGVLVYKYKTLLYSKILNLYSYIKTLEGAQN